MLIVNLIGNYSENLTTQSTNFSPAKSLSSKALATTTSEEFSCTLPIPGAISLRTIASCFLTLPKTRTLTRPANAIGCPLPSAFIKNAGFSETTALATPILATVSSFSPPHLRSVPTSYSASVSYISAKSAQ